MKKIRISLEILLVLIAMMSFIKPQPCLAAGANVDITADNTIVTVGDTVYVYIKINSGTTFGDFEANLTYDKNILKYKEGSSVITGGSGFLKISDMGNDITGTSRKYALKFEALKTGESNIIFADDVMVYDESGNALPVSSENLKIKVNAKKSASTDAYLKTLETSPAGITPDFDKKVYDYSLTVDNSINQLIVNAVPEDVKANVSMTGNDNLKEGQNKITITVLAESGGIIKYTINVNRKAAPTVTLQPTITPVVTAATVQTAFQIIQNNGEIYAVLNARYKLVEPGTEVAIPEGYAKTSLTITGITIPAYVPENDPQSEFVLIYAENPSGIAGFYRYDTSENTLQRYVPVTADETKANTDTNHAAIIISVLSTLSALLAAAVIGLLIRQKHNKRNGY